MTLQALKSSIITSSCCVFIIFLSACGGSSDSAFIPEPPVSGPPAPGPAPDPTPPPAQPGSAFESRNSTARFLTQATFGPTPGELDRLTGTSASAWFRSELNKPASLITPEFARYRMMQQADSDDFTAFAGETATFAFWHHAVAGDDQLRQRVAFALSEILVVSNGGGEVLSDIPEAVAWYQDVLRRNALGNYRTLLEAVTYAPAMGYYLTYMGNAKADPATGQMPDENYAREILQLFSIGLLELNRDGSLRLGASGQPIETYDNADITGLAKVFTGLDIDEPDTTQVDETSGASWQLPMRIVPINHSDAEKSFIGTTIPEFTDARSSITQALDAIFAHPNVAPFISRQLIQRLTTSAPSPTYIDRVAVAFEAGSFMLPDGLRVGAGQRGDLTATIAAILFDDEARTAPVESNTTFGKVREPILRFTAWARAFEVSTVTPELTLELWGTGDSNALAQHPYRASSVFNFFRPGYIAPGSESGAAGLTAPELQIVNASSSPGYANFMNRFVRAEISDEEVAELRQVFADEQVNLDPELARRSFVPDYAGELALVADLPALVDRLADKLTYGSMRGDARQQLVNVLSQYSATPGQDDTDLVHLAVVLMLLSPDFLVQR
ncbi:MAG: DUF1800 domain-containing protein [Pseudomonadota bacterium]